MKWIIDWIHVLMTSLLSFIGICYTCCINQKVCCVAFHSSVAMANSIDGVQTRSNLLAAIIKCIHVLSSASTLCIVTWWITTQQFIMTIHVYFYLLIRYKIFHNSRTISFYIDMLTMKLQYPLNLYPWYWYISIWKSYETVS